MKLFALFLLLTTVLTVRILNMPLDERFATRINFLNLALLTPYVINTQPESLLPSLKLYKSPAVISQWFTNQAPANDVAIISLQMLLYGGLIASRTSNDTLAQVKIRIDALESVKSVKPSLKIYGSAVVMRIPQFNVAVEQPNYWQQYGRSIYFYSFYTDKYSQTKNQSDYQQSQIYKKQIPEDVLNDFTTRRTRNHQVLIYLLNRFAASKQKGRKLFEKLYITLDDNAQYGFNIAQARQLKALVANLSLSQQILIYPGADQVHLSLLAKYTSDYYNEIININTIYRNQSTSSLIPNYEGEPLIDTVRNQIIAAGGRIYPAPAVTLLINNFDGPTQKQAPNQAGDQPTNYTIFDRFVCDSSQIVGYVDNKYSNGADIAFVQYLLQKNIECKRGTSKWSYAGWNTNGNTLGTTISNAVILYFVQKYGNINQNAVMVKAPICPQCSPCNPGDYTCANSYFNLLRILEDRDWQAILRQKLVSYIVDVPTDNVYKLDSDLPFYERFSFKSMKAKGEALCKMLDLKFKIDSVYYPWNRTFQIGIVGSINQSSNQIEEII